MTEIRIEQHAFESIDGIESNVIVVKGEPHICVSDIQKQLDIPRITLHDIIKSIKQNHSNCILQVNGNYLQFDDNQPCRQSRQGSFQKNTLYNFINETGYNLMMQKINPDTVRDEDKRKLIITHQQGMAEVFAKYRRKELVDVKSVQPAVHPALRSPEQVCQDKIGLGMCIANLFDIPKQMAVTVSINEAQRETGIDFSNYQKLLPPVDGTYEEPKIGAQDLGKPYGDNGRKVNQLLQKLGYIYKDNGKWQMTEMGKKRGGAWFTFTASNGHTDTHIRWPTQIKDVIELHNDFFECKP